MRSVVLDTNALLLPFKDGTDVVAELERLLGAVRPVVPSCVVAELGALAVGGGAAARAAAAAQRLTESWTVAETDLRGDDGVFAVARAADALVTNDGGLQQRARAAGLLVVASRGRGRLHVIGR
jgi:hypothetical protein